MWAVGYVIMCTCEVYVHEPLLVTSPSPLFFGTLFPPLSY